MSNRKEILVQLLKDPDSGVSSSAAAALGLIEEQQSLDEVLTQLKKGGLAEKVRAIYALGEIGGEKVLAPLIYCASRPEPELKGAAIDALGTVLNRAAVPVLLEKLKDDNSGIRARAIKALGGFKDSSLAQHFIPFLEAGDGLTDVEAALALGNIGDPAMEDILCALAHSPVAVSRAAAATALGLLKPA